MYKRLIVTIIILSVACLAGFSSSLYLAGSINEKYPIFMFLAVEGKTANGWYYYQSQGGKLILVGQVTGEGVITLDEQGADGKVTGHFKGTLADGIFKGQWNNASANYNFSLTSVAETMTANLTKDDAFSVTNEFPFFTGSARAVSLNKDIFQTNQQQITDFFNNCYEFFSDLKAEDRNIPAPWTSELSYTIELYNDSLISIMFSSYDYSGGAHGNTYYFVKNYRLTPTGFKPLALTDVFKNNTIANGLSALIVANLKEQQASSVVDGEKQSFKPDELQFFTLTPAGINFHFAPYEVGAYAEGAFVVFIPYEKLKPLLNKEMATLLKLNS